MNDGAMLLIVGALLAGGLAVSTLAGRVRVPGLVLVLGLGMAIGTDGLGWLSFSDYQLARTVGVVALSLILFEGGVAAGWDEIRPVLGSAVSLAVIGTAATAMLGGLAAAWLFGLPLAQGLLLGSILASTDGAAVFAVLRGSQLRRRLARTLEGEAGMNDPVAVVLVLGFISFATDSRYDLLDFLWLFVRQLGIGLAVGGVVAAAAVWALRNVRLPSAGLYPVASLAAASIAYGGAAVLNGSGFLAVYLTGLAIGSVPSPAQRTIATFHDGLAWVAQLTLFLVLGLLVFPDQLGSVAVKGSVLALIVAVVARPVATVLATLFARFSIAEQATLGWAGLRGAVPVVLATFPVIRGVAHSHEFFNIVFFAVLVSTVVQGSTFEPLARKLHVTTSEAALPAPLIESSAIRRLGAEVVEFVVGRDHAAAGLRVRELGLPRDALLNIVIRDGQALPPRGSTRIEVGDRLHILVRQEVAGEFQSLLGRWRDGPLGPPKRARPSPRASSPIFSSGPWREVDGDLGRPARIREVDVIEQLRTRRDVPGALVALADGRFAYTGHVTAIGSASQLQDAARRRLHLADDDSERAWWREVIGALAEP
ncbi:MAG TPA: potassium/proton antiporter [Solirubrobacteraceae bacterium]